MNILKDYNDLYEDFPTDISILIDDADIETDANDSSTEKKFLRFSQFNFSSSYINFPSILSAHNILDLLNINSSYYAGNLVSIVKFINSFDIVLFRDSEWAELGRSGANIVATAPEAFIHLSWLLRIPSIRIFDDYTYTHDIGTHRIHSNGYLVDLKINE
jgi:hypothetical protein